MTPEDRKELARATVLHRHLVAQHAAEKARREQDEKVPEPLGAYLVARQAHCVEMWESGGRLRRAEAEPEPACETCKGARWLAVRHVLPVHTVPCPDCFYEWQAGRIHRRWPLSPKEQELAAKPFRERRDAPEMAEAFRVVKTFGATVIAGKADMLSLTGPVGIGKTHLMLLLAALVMAANKGVVYRTATRLQNILQDFGYDADSKREAEERRQVALHDLTRVPLLIVDEAEKGWSDRSDDKGQWFRAQMLDIINARRNQHLATALAGNDLFRLPAPVLSRAQAHGCNFVILAGVPDARPVLET